MLLLEKKESKFLELGKVIYGLAKSSKKGMAGDSKANQLITDIKKIEALELKAKKWPEKTTKKKVKKAPGKAKSKK